MVSWIVIGVLVLLLFVILKFKRFRHMQNRLYMAFLILLILFFYVSSSKIIQDSKADLKTFDGWVTAGKLYFNWLGQLFHNAGVLVGNAIKMNWQGNSTVK